MTNLNEKKIKSLVIAELIRRKKIRPGTLIANELALQGMSCRADLAFLASKFIGIEIKSEFDSLKRLTSQMSAYMRIFDQSILVAAEIHIPKASKQLPASVEIWGINKNGLIFLHRKGKHCSKPDPRDLFCLLTVQELRLLLSKERSRRDNRQTLLEAAACLELSVVQKAVRASFSKKYSATSAVFWDTRGLDDLSRFKKQREQIDARQLKQKLFWKNWVSTTELLLAS